ncbi:MAG: polysaccharide biosynthesis tyrosine autokinase [Thauera sp.]|nr:polysaccharide biosynthesis tyrosine autokinase [Thauera sp.]
MTPDLHKPLPAQVAATDATVVADDEEGFNLGEFVATLLEFKWLILAVTAVGLVMAVIAVFVATPIYRADALLQVESKGKGKGLAALEGVQAVLQDSTSVTTELEILNSRMILGRVVDRLNRAVNVAPRHAPFIGAALARRHAGNKPASPLLGLSQYAWGGERIVVESLEVERHLIGAPLTLVAGDEGRYRLLDAAGTPLADGRVGEAVSGEGVSLFVSDLMARPGTEFILTRTSREAAIDALRGQLQAKERTRGSNVLEVALLGPDRGRIVEVLNEVLNAYVRQNVEYRSAEAQNTLVFLESQLPLLKSQVDAAESAYNSYRQNRGSVDLTIETQSVLGGVVAVDNEIVSLQQKRDELRQRYTPEHPQMQALDAQIARLRGRRSALDKDVARLPDTQQTALRLKRDVEVSTALYTDLLNSAQQLRVARAGTVGDVRIIDTAVAAPAAVEPRKNLILLVGGALGLLGGLAVVLIMRSLRITVDDPDRIEKELGLPVYATVPHSKVEAELMRSGGGEGGQRVLAVAQPEDDAVESLRSLRTTLHFALLDSARGAVLITGPAQGVGKSFISRNLGAVLAQAGKRVVVVDADLRKGHIHKEFGFARQGGVSEFIAGSAGLAEVIRPTKLAGLHVITTGQIPPNPSELLMHPRFEELLQSLEQEFDTIIVDAPPVLAVSDAAIVGRHVGATLMVVRAGRHPMRELEQSVKRLGQAGVAVKGFVFNDMDMTRQRYRYGYKGYVYRYTYKS